MIKIRTLLLALGCVVISHIAYAGIYWLPSYVGENNGLGYGKRTNDSDPITPSSCSTYGYVNSCGSHMTGTRTLVAQGLYCYKDCKCDTSYYKYNSTNCPSPLTLAGEFCNNGTMATECVCGSSYNLTSEPYCVLYDKCQDTSTHYRVRTDSTGKVICKSGCTYDSDTNTCYEPSTCEASGYSSSPKDSNLYNCTKVVVDKARICYACTCNSSYDQINCPANCTCSQCENLFKVTGAATNYVVSADGKSCVASSCPAGYTAGVTKCSNSWEDISFSGMSGTQQCGKCVCRDANSACTSTAYPLTSQPQNASFDSCQAGCGDYTTRYKLKTCNSGYTLSADGKSCEKILCSNGGYKDSQPFGYKCDTISYNGLTCYTNCQEEVTDVCTANSASATMPTTNNSPETGLMDSCDNVKNISGTRWSYSFYGGQCYKTVTYGSQTCYKIYDVGGIVIHAGTHSDESIMGNPNSISVDTFQVKNLNYDYIDFIIYDSSDMPPFTFHSNNNMAGSCDYFSGIARSAIVIDDGNEHDLGNLRNGNTKYLEQENGPGIYVVQVEVP